MSSPHARTETKESGRTRKKGGGGGLEVTLGRDGREVDGFGGG